MTLHAARPVPTLRPLILKATLVVPTVIVWTHACLSAYEASGLPDMDIDACLSGPFPVREMMAMWLVMLAAMMGPAVLPWTRALSRAAGGGVAPAFLCAYAAVWLLAASGATGLQWALSSTGVLSPSLIVGDPAVRGVAFILVGGYQWSPLKDACLTHCESPATFFLSRWRDGPAGALVMGAQHGLYCVGCCWPAMALMVAAGAMSAVWMAGVTLYTLSEMYVPELRPLSRAAGALMIVAGLASLMSGG